MNFIWHASPRLCLPDFDTFEKKLEEKARKPCKNSGWLGKLLKTCCNRIMSHFYYRLLLIDDVESIWEESAARNHTLFRTGGSTFSEMTRFFRAHYPNSTKTWGNPTAAFFPPIAAKKRWSTGRGIRDKKKKSRWQLSLLELFWLSNATFLSMNILSRFSLRIEGTW